MIIAETKTNYKQVSPESNTLKKIVEYGRVHRQLGLYLYLLEKYRETGEGLSLHHLHSFYSKMIGRPIHEETVRRQLKLLINKGLVREEGGAYYPVPLPAEVVVKLFDVKRAEAGRVGAIKRLRQVIYENSLPAVKTLPKSLKYYVETIVEKARKLVEEGKREVALDLVVHTLLPLRENGVLWLWRGDEFIYYEKKTMNEGIFHCVRFPALSKLLQELGFQEGIMVHHVLGHDEASDIIRKIFGKGYLSWPWARSVFYGLKRMGLAEEGSYYILELEYRDIMIYLYLRDYPFYNLIKAYSLPWRGSDGLPPPLSVEKPKVRYPVIGKQHIKEENEGSYFSRW